MIGRGNYLLQACLQVQDFLGSLQKMHSGPLPDPVGYPQWL